MLQSKKELNLNVVDYVPNYLIIYLILISNLSENNKNLRL